MRCRITGFVVLAAAYAAAFPIRRPRAADEDADEIASGFFAQLLRALPVDVEQNVAACASAFATGLRGVP